MNVYLNDDVFDVRKIAIQVRQGLCGKKRSIRKVLMRNVTALKYECVETDLERLAQSLTRDFVVDDGAKFTEGFEEQAGI